MGLTKFTGNTNVISELADTPTLTSEELKAKFDEAGSNIKKYINETLTGEIEQSISNDKAILQKTILNTKTELNNTIAQLDSSTLKFTVSEEFEENKN